MVLLEAHVSILCLILPRLIPRWLLIDADHMSCRVPTRVLPGPPRRRRRRPSSSSSSSLAPARQTLAND